MYNHQSELLTPHESIITQETPGCEFTMNNYVDMPNIGTPTFTELDFHLQHDVTSSNYFTYNTDPSNRLGVPGTDMFCEGSMQEDLPYQHQISNLMRDMYGPISSENSGFVPGLMEGYNMDQFDSPRVGGKRKRGGNLTQNRVVEKKEKQRRERLSEKFELLKAIIPNRTKDDRATIVSDAIDYIHELCRTVNELKLLVEKKRHKSSMSFNKDAVNGDIENSDVANPSMVVGEKELGLINKGPTLRSSWLQRKSKEASVDVRIIEDEVNIKITKKKKAIGCLLPVSRAVDELRLQVLHLSGGVIGECHVYMLNTQIIEGTPVYASAVAKKIIEVIDMQ